MLKAALVECENYVIPFFHNNLGRDSGQKRETTMRMRGEVTTTVASPDDAAVVITRDVLDWLKRRQARPDSEKSSEIASRVMANAAAKGCIIEFVAKPDAKEIVALGVPGFYDAYKK